MQQLTITFRPDRAPIDGQHVTASGLHGLLFHVLQQANPQGGYWLAGAAGAMALDILFYTAIRRPTSGQINIKEKYKPAARQELVLRVGPTEADALYVIEYHLPTLKQCWLIATAELQSFATALTKRYGDRVRMLHWRGHQSTHMGPPVRQLACLTKNTDLQYMKATHDASQWSGYFRSYTRNCPH